ncbi:MAG: apolipoprotein N-acyltransferase [Betaproteobacteria bacterium]
MSFLRLILVPFALGALAVTGFAPFGFYVVPPLALAALLLLWRHCESMGATAGIGFAFGAGMFLAGVSWVYVSLHFYGGMAMPVAAFATLLFCAILACYPALAGIAMWLVPGDARLKFMLLFPGLWAVSEWLRGWMFSGFPWLAMGYSQVPSSPLAGFAPLLGVFGVSLVTATLAGGLATIADSVLQKRAQRKLFSRTFYFGLGTSVVLVIAGAALKAQQWTQPAPGAPIKVTLLQGNIAQDLKWDPARAIATLDIYMQLLDNARGGLILLPETALPLIDVDVPPEYITRLAARAVQNGGDVLYGVPEFDPSGRYYNSVKSAGSAPVQTYRKVHLVPFGDYFPLRPILGWVMTLLHIPMSDFSHGPEVQKPLQVAGQRVAVNICYEDAFGEEIIRQLPEATLLANFTNDAWWGDTIASKQHLQIAQMRALETGRSMLRATNTGVTAIIGPDGQVVAAAPEFKTTSLSGEVQGRQGRTPYIFWGNAGFLLLSAIMIAIAPLSARMRRKSREAV